LNFLNLNFLELFDRFELFLSFFEPRKGQFFWLWLKKAQNSSKRLSLPTPD
jgi:hypothetical protein